jgi:Protein of unknown function (DUF1553)/Protein of unknown function (DUF1549)/Planctomycete cytochrome C
MPCRFAWFAGFLVALPAIACAAPAEKVDFNRDVRPILSENCFQCHGPDKGQRKADLRLDQKTGLFATKDNGPVVVPAKPAESQLFVRITSKDNDLHMPPADSGRKLSARQIEVIRRWIEQGAEWKGHWAYIPPTRPAVPDVGHVLSVFGGAAPTIRNPIDRFIVAALHEQGLSQSPEADRVTLIRRLSFDLRGLPPTAEEVDRFVSDRSPQAYEDLVERFLASPHYGERMALYWLDLVRFADTNGIHSDNHREHAPFRDYVIDAFNENKPFDVFTTEQLAGDLLPNPGREQRIASGYNRLNLTTEEGGAQPKEYIAKYAADRVRNASSVWLGATLGCAECHDHKFDPYTSRDFYSFEAFFADVQETAVGQQKPVSMPTDEQAAELRRLDERIAALRRESGNGGKSAPPAAVPKEAAQQEIAALAKRKQQIQQEAPLILVAMAGAPRTVRILPRGNWLDETGEIVQPNTPGFLKPLGVKGRRATRLDLAHWLVDADNPLTARVFVNRLWKLLFGSGLATSLEDFGAQGAWPTHPALLDWLAVEFHRSGWDVKHLVRLLVTSATYRQASVATAELQQHDPYNRWFARQGRFVLDAEFIRDNALAVSGLLVPKFGGRSVKPYQPAGYWAYLNFPRREWHADVGEDQYRRGLYTYWCRTFPHPSMIAFNATSREACTVERAHSNTPLQALALLNDPSYVEAARTLAERTIAAESSPEGRIGYVYRQALSRAPEPAEAQVLARLYDKHLAQYRADGKAAAELLSVGQRPVPPRIDQAELAAWTSVARVILNLHETITRR